MTQSVVKNSNTVNVINVNQIIMFCFHHCFLIYVSSTNDKKSIKLSTTEVVYMAAT